MSQVRSSSPSIETEDPSGVLSGPYGRVLRRAHERALDYLTWVDREPVAATADVEALRARLVKPLADDGLDPVRVLDELAEDVREGLIGNVGRRFFAWVIGGTVPSSLGAEWMASVWDQNAALYSVSPAAAVVEEAAAGWLKELLGLPSTASYAFVTGCQMAHVTCLAAARHAVLEARGWDVERQGLFGAPPIRVLTSDQRHGSIDRAVRLLGMGLDTLVDLPADDDGRLDPQTLEAALDTHRGQPVIVHVQAGDINTGSFDVFSDLIPMAHAHDAWVHVDGAFGLWANASPTYRQLLAGVDHADSWSTDGHKWLNVPYDVGYAFIAHPDAHRRSMSYRASYLAHDEGGRDEFDWNPEWSRRARGLATYAAIRELGRDGVASLIDRTCLHAHDMVSALAEIEGCELLYAPVINQGLVRFAPPGGVATEEQYARFTDDVIREVCATGEAFFQGTTWRGRRCMRVSVLNWQTDGNDVARAVAAVRAVLKASRR